MNDEKIMNGIDKFIDDILHNRYFNNHNFKNKLQDFISYKEHIFFIGGFEYKVNGNDEDVKKFQEMILAEIFLKVLVNLRDYLLKSEKMLIDIKSKYSTKKKYTSMFLFDGEDIVELINKCCDEELVRKLKDSSKNKYPNEVAENFCFIENFHKDNAILKLLVMNLDGMNIVNKAFIDENNPKYEIELKFKNNTIYNAKSIENKRLDKFIKLYETVFNICTNKIVAENNYINKWLSLYEINEISRFINIINIGYERMSFNYIEKINNMLKSEKCNFSEYSREHELIVRRLLLENKIIILNYFLYHNKLFEKIFDANNKKYYELLKEIFSIIDTTSEKITDFIKKYGSIDIILSVIDIIKDNLNKIKYEKLFHVKFEKYNGENNDSDTIRNRNGEGIIDMYNMYLNL